MPTLIFDSSDNSRICVFTYFKEEESLPAVYFYDIAMEKEIGPYHMEVCKIDFFIANPFVLHTKSYIILFTMFQFFK